MADQYRSEARVQVVIGDHERLVDAQPCAPDTKPGYEYNVVLVAALCALAATGTSAVSLAHVLGVELAGTGSARWAPACSAVSARW
jgi:hypothetical protein